MVVSDVKSGYPGRSFFVPYAIIITPFGDLISNEARLAVPIFASESLTQLPPFGVEYVDEGEQFLVSVEDRDGPPVAKLTALAHKVQRAE
jgi:hypothetical protein